MSTTNNITIFAKKDKSYGVMSTWGNSIYSKRVAETRSYFSPKFEDSKKIELKKLKEKINKFLKNEKIELPKGVYTFSTENCGIAGYRDSSTLVAINGVEGTDFFLHGGYYGHKSDPKHKSTVNSPRELLEELVDLNTDRYFYVVD